MAGSEKSSFVLYTKNSKQFAMLSDEQAGKLIKGIFSYVERQITPDFGDSTIQIAFSFIQSYLDMDMEKWEETRNRRIEAGRKGGRQTQANKANASFAEKTKANQAVSESVSVSVSEYVSVNNPPISPPGDESEHKIQTNSFEDFWKAYPKKVSKTNALKAWEKLQPDDKLVRLILDALENQKKDSQWQKEDGRFIPYPASWLKAKRWEDEARPGEESGEDHSYDLEDYKAFVNNFS